MHQGRSHLVDAGRVDEQVILNKGYVCVTDSIGNAPLPPNTLLQRTVRSCSEQKGRVSVSGMNRCIYSSSAA
jgi:hypothetical protein